jgi:hypothetical protein
MALRSVETIWAPAAVPTGPGDGLPAPGAYDLVDFPTALDELNIDPADPKTPLNFIARAITEVSSGIADHCNRIFQVEGVTELCSFDRGSGLTPGTVAPLPLRRFPLANLTTLLAAAETDSGDVLTFASPLPSAVAVGQPVAHRAIPLGATVAAILGTTQIQLSAPLSTDSTALATSVLAGDTVVFGMSVGRRLDTAYLQSLGPAVDFAIDQAVGRLFRLNPYTLQTIAWDSLDTTVSYYGGYATIPPAVQAAALRWITQRYFQRGRDPMLRTLEQPGLGTQTWWVGGPTNSGIPEEIVGALQPYVRLLQG